MPVGTQPEYSRIVDVWAHNLEEEFKRIRVLIRQFPFVAMDTEFPGIVARPIGEFKNNVDYQYNLLRCNVNLLKLIQIGFTFSDNDGRTPSGCSTWQFNFKFDLNLDMYAQDSIELLTNAGIQFEKHSEQGIEMNDFAELLTSSGVVLENDVLWLSFHSGYDFGYLIKMLTGNDLPDTEKEFFDYLYAFFPKIYDVKYLMKSCKNLKGGLQEVSEQLEVSRIGPQHQAGSDSLLTGASFFKMRELFFEDKIDDAKYLGHLYGLGTAFYSNGNSSLDSTNSLSLRSGTRATATPPVGPTSTPTSDAAATNSNNSVNTSVPSSVGTS